MKRSQYAIVFLLGAAIATGAIYFGDRVMYPYRRLRSITPLPYVHPLAKQLERAKKLRAEGKLADAQKLLREQLRLYPNALQAQAGRDLLGELNTQMFFSTDNLFGKTEYAVKRGDSLWRIARKFDSTPAIIKRANELESELIHPGEQLLIPDNDFTVTLDLPNQRVVVHHGDGFFKQYPIVDINLPRSRETQIAVRRQFRAANSLRPFSPRSRSARLVYFWRRPMADAPFRRRRIRSTELFRLRLRRERLLGRLSLGAARTVAAPMACDIP